MVRYRSTKAQAFGIDLLIAIAIFFSALIIFYFYALNFSHEGEDTKNEMNYEAGVLSGILISSGDPENWTSENLVSPGMVDNGKVNDTKLEQLHNFSRDNYASLKKVLNLDYDFYFYFSENMIINGIETAGIGKPGENQESIIGKAQNLVIKDRIVNYHNKPMKLSILLWEE